VRSRRKSSRRTSKRQFKIYLLPRLTGCHDLSDRQRCLLSPLPLRAKSPLDSSVSQRHSLHSTIRSGSFSGREVRFKKRSVSRSMRSVRFWRIFSRRRRLRQGAYVGRDLLHRSLHRADSHISAYRQSQPQGPERESPDVLR